MLTAITVRDARGNVVAFDEFYNPRNVAAFVSEWKSKGYTVDVRECR